MAKTYGSSVVNLVRNFYITLHIASFNVSLAVYEGFFVFHILSKTCLLSILIMAISTSVR